jgi:hypothetical protein
MSMHQTRCFAPHSYKLSVPENKNLASTVLDGRTWFLVITVQQHTALSRSSRKDIRSRQSYHDSNDGILPFQTKFSRSSPAERSSRIGTIAAHHPIHHSVSDIALLFTRRHLRQQKSTMLSRQRLQPLLPAGCAHLLEQSIVLGHAVQSRH